MQHVPSGDHTRSFLVESRIRHLGAARLKLHKVFSGLLPAWLLEGRILSHHRWVLPRSCLKWETVSAS